VCFFSITKYTGTTEQTIYTQFIMVLKVRAKSNMPHHQSMMKLLEVMLTISPQTLGAKAAAALDKELMSSGAFSIDQLMELAGLSVSQAGMAAREMLAAHCVT
jgi:hypothetical protein